MKNECEPGNNKRILLLNPPGDKLYIRDYYCSKISKAEYLYEAPDLLIQSGYFYDAGYEIKIIDAIAEKFSSAQCYAQIIDFCPAAIIFITGSVSHKSDLQFLSRVKSSLPATKIIGSGDIFMEDSDKRLQEYPCLDAVVLDFTTPDILKFVEGKTPENMVYRKGKKIICALPVRKKFKFISIPLPRHDLFPLHKYNYPFVKKPEFATVLTDYGCPFRCYFCIMPKLGFKIRTVSNVMEELQYIQSMGISEIYFDDQTFGAHRQRTIELCNAMIQNKLDMGWVCFSRVDVVDEGLLRLMKQAGCHTIMFGVESGNQEILDRQFKGLKKEKINGIFQLCKKIGIRTLATYMIGLPGDTVKTVKDTIRFSKELDSDFASFNMPVPRMGTDLRLDAIKQGRITSEFDEMNQSSSHAFLETDALTLRQISFYKNYAVFSYFFRPKYILRRLLSIRSYNDILIHFRALIGIIKNFIYK